MRRAAVVEGSRAAKCKAGRGTFGQKTCVECAVQVGRRVARAVFIDPHHGVACIDHKIGGREFHTLDDNGMGC